MTKSLRRIEIALGSAFFLGVCATGLLCRDVFWFDLVANLRVQLAIALILLLGYVFIRRRKVLAGFIGLAWLTTIVPILWGGILVASPSHRVNGDHVGRDFVTLTTLNVLSHNTRYDAVLNHLEMIDPDVFAILELTSIWDDEIRSRFETTHPHRLVQASDTGNFGIGIYSKIPFQESNVVSWGNWVPSLDVTLLSPNIRVIATHPIPPMSSPNFVHRNRQLDEVASAVAISGPSRPTIVMGDFNLTPWSPLFRDFVDTSGLLPVRRRFDMKPTWYGGPDYLPFGLVLDHVFVTQGIEPLSMAIGPDVGSDHRSVTVQCRPRTIELIP